MTNREFRIQSNVSVHGLHFAWRQEVKRLRKLGMNMEAARGLAFNNVKKYEQRIR